MPETFDPASSVLDMVTDAVATQGPIVLAVGGAVVGLAIAGWGVRTVIRTIGRGGKSVG